MCSVSYYTLVAGLFSLSSYLALDQPLQAKQDALAASKLSPQDGAVRQVLAQAKALLAKEVMLSCSRGKARVKIF
jgi:hypothetical protein